MDGTVINGVQDRLSLFRDGPLEIIIGAGGGGGGGSENVLVQDFFKEPACLQESFSRAYHLLFLDITACRVFLDTFPLQDFFFGELSPPPVISNGRSLITLPTPNLQNRK